MDMKGKRMNKLKQFAMQYKGTPAYIALCVAVANAVFFGTANFTIELGFSIWGAAVFAMCVGALILMPRDVKRIFKNPLMWVLLAYAMWIVISAVRGYMAGNSITYIMGDVQDVIYFVLFPVTLCILCSESRITKLMKIVMYSGFALGLLTLIYNVCYVFLPELFGDLLYWGYYGQMINYTRISATVSRVLFVSAPMQLFCCTFSMYFMATEKRHMGKYAVLIGTCLTSILMTFTRSLYLAAFVAAVATIVILLVNGDHSSRAYVAKGIGMVIAVCALLILVFSVAAKTNYFGFALQRVFVNGGQDVTATEQTEIASTENLATDASVGESAPAVITTEPTASEPVTEETSSENQEGTVAPDDNTTDFKTLEGYLQATEISDSVRERTQKELHAYIALNPLAGVGLGMRLSDRQTAPEYFYLDMCAKTGIIGVLLFITPFAFVFVDILKRSVSHQPVLISGVWAVGLLGLMVYSVFQPYMNNAPCILMYCCVLSVSCWQKRSIQK